MNDTKDRNRIGVEIISLMMKMKILVEDWLDEGGFELWSVKNEERTERKRKKKNSEEKDLRRKRTSKGLLMKRITIRTVNTNMLYLISFFS